MLHATFGHHIATAVQTNNDMDLFIQLNPDFKRVAMLRDAIARRELGVLYNHYRQFSYKVISARATMRDDLDSRARELDGR